MKLQKKLAAGKFAVLAEVEPPKGTDVAGMVAAAVAVKRKVDAFVVPEMNSAVMRLSSLGGALLLQGRGLETVMQVCCRDRNRLALQGDLLAAQALGVSNVMAVTGEDITHGDHHQAKEVRDLGLLDLLRAIQTLQAGRDLAGVELKGAPQFLVGATLKVAPPGPVLDAELQALDEKIALGARFFVTNPVFNLEVLDQFLQAAGGRPAHIIPTVLLLKSVGMARYIDKHIEGVNIPVDFIDRIQKAPDRVRECVHLAGELVAALKDRGASGVHLATLGWEDKLPSILDAAGV